MIYDGSFYTSIHTYPKFVNLLVSMEANDGDNRPTMKTLFGSSIQGANI
jgi:hypothetical protein